MDNQTSKPKNPPKRKHPLGVTHVRLRAKDGTFHDLPIRPCPFSATDGGDGNHSWKESSNRYPGDFHCRYCGNYASGRLPI